MKENPYAQWTLNFNSMWLALKAHRLTSDTIANPNDLYLTLGSGERNYAEQADLYAKGRSAPGPIVTRAKPGQSAHNFGLARDLILHNQAHHTDDEVTDLYAMVYFLATENYLETGFKWRGIYDPLHIQLPKFAKRAKCWARSSDVLPG